MLYKFNGKEPKVGKHTYISELAHVIGDVIIGDECYIGHGAILRADYGAIEIGDGTAIEEVVVVHAFPRDTSRIGNGVTIGHGAIAHAKSIGDRVVIGMGAILSVGSEIGEGSIVAEGSVVIRKQSIPANVVVAGNPAAIVRETSEKDNEFWTWGKKVYVDLARQYLEEGMEPVG